MSSLETSEEKGNELDLFNFDEMYQDEDGGNMHGMNGIFGHNTESALIQENDNEIEFTKPCGPTGRKRNTSSRVAAGNNSSSSSMLASSSRSRKHTPAGGAGSGSDNSSKKFTRSVSYDPSVLTSSSASGVESKNGAHYGSDESDYDSDADEFYGIDSENDGVFSSSSSSNRRNLKMAKKDKGGKINASLSDASGASDADTGNNSSSNSSVEVKAKEKNREHAKNTRMRKKTYIESLKDDVKQLNDWREKTDTMRKLQLQAVADQVQMRKKVIGEFLIFRTFVEQSPAQWEKLLDPNFVLVLPITPYRSFPPSEVFEGRRVIRGVDAVISDTVSISAMLQSIASPINDGNFVRAQFYSLNEETICAGNRLMSKWYLNTVNAVERGAMLEVSNHGMMKAIFTPSNKLLTLEMTFDVMSFMQQIRKASGKNDFEVIPNIYRVAVEMNPERRIVLSCAEPYQIVHCSENWGELYGFAKTDLIGKTMETFHGPETETAVIADMMKSANSKKPSRAFITHYIKGGDKIVVRMQCYPIYGEGRVKNLLIVVEPSVEADPNASKSSNLTDIDSANINIGGNGTETAATQVFDTNAAMESRQAISRSASVSSFSGDIGMSNKDMTEQIQGWVAGNPFDTGSAGTVLRAGFDD